MKYAIGLDIGITSVGYAAVMLDDDDKANRIIRLGSRIFEAAEHPKDGSSLAAPRREFRGLRRRLRRKRLRKETVRYLIEKNDIATTQEMNEIFNGTLSDIYEIRCRALDECLKKEEFVRLLIHLSQRRGFKSNRKTDSEDNKSDAGKLLTAVNSNKELMLEKGYRTIGEMLYKDEKFIYAKRNKGGVYTNTFARKDYEDEIKLIFEKQREYSNSLATESFQEEYLKTVLSQRSFDEGPGGNSKYGGNQIEKMLGKCTFEKDEFRAVKASFSFEYFSLLSKVNSIKIVSSGKKRFLTESERSEVISLCFKQKNVSYQTLRKTLKLEDYELFNISYGNGVFSEIEKKTKFTYLNAYHTMHKKYGDCFVNWSTEKKNNLAYALSVYKNDEKIVAYLTEKGFESSEIEVALTIPSFSKTANLSVKALDKINIYLQKGFLYNEACEKAGYDFKAEGKSLSNYLPAVAPELEDISNPVVRRAVAQTIKVINALIREIGESPCYVNLELARELSKNFKDRNDIKKKQDNNQAQNERIMKRLREEFGLENPTGLDLIRLKLWEEQDGICPYSLKPISIEKLFDVGYTDIDHIIPYSISFDDSYNNKVLVFSSENRQKGNRIPMQYLTEDKKDKFYIWVDNSNLRYKKKKNLLKEELTDDDVSGFKKRNLNDTQYISRFMLNFIKKYLYLQPNNTDTKDTVKSVNGQATAYLRKRWGITKIRANGDVHHAVDALVVACMSRAMINRIHLYSKYRETEYINPITGEYFDDVDTKTGEIINRFPMPYDYLRTELEILCSGNPTAMLHESPLPNYAVDEKIDPIFVSRMPNRKVKGSAHKETIRATYSDDSGDYSVSKVPLTSLKLDKNGEIEGYFNPSSDTLLYNALLNRLTLYGGNAAEAFKEPFYKPKSDGTRGPLVNKVKIKSKSTLSVPVLKNTAIADNGSMVRVDVFFVEGEGYYLVPIYVADTVKSVLPNKAIIAGKSYDKWKEMNDSDFIFSLYPNDLIYVKARKDIKMTVVNDDSTLPKHRIYQDAYLYYKKCGISTGSMTVINHDNTYSIPSLGAKTLVVFEKCQVDVLGNITKVGKEKRMGFK